MGRKKGLAGYSYSNLDTTIPKILPIISQADIVIFALGFLIFKGRMVKDDAVIIDVGLRRVLMNQERGYYINW